MVDKQLMGARRSGLAAVVVGLILIPIVAAAEPAPAAAKPEPAKPESAKPEPAKAESAKAESAKPESAKPEPAKPEPAKPEAKAATKAPPRPKAKPKAGIDPDKIGEGPSPATPPPLTIAGLRDETSREGGSSVIDPAAPARSKIELMLEEITKARTSLREDTSRLEAMLTQDGDAAPPGAAPGAAGPGAPGAKPAKNPLDILAKALRGIKPEQAAPIVARLDKRLAATVLQRMPPVDAGKIMGAMKPDTAAELATQIAMRPLSPEAKR